MNKKMAQKKIGEKKNVQDRKPVLFARTSKDKKYLILRASKGMEIEEGTAFLFGRDEIVGLFKGTKEWAMAAPLPPDPERRQKTKPMQKDPNEEEWETG